MDFLIIFLLVILNGVFAMSEIAIVSSRKSRLMKLASEGRAGAAAALKISEEPTRFLSTVQIGITSIGVLNGLFGASALAGPLAAWFASSFGIEIRQAEIAATFIVVAFITYLSIVVGELVPKRIGQIYAEPIAMMAAAPMRLLSTIARPFVMLLSFSTGALLKLLGVRSNGPSTITEEEIHAILEESSEAGVIEQREREMVRNLFRLDDRQLGSLMIPRSDIIYIDTEATGEENLNEIINADYSLFPVCEGGLDKVLGIISAKQVLAALAKGQKPNFKDNLYPAVYVPETLTGAELLEQFRSNHIHMVFVVDEYGEIEGLITLKDLLEAVTGEFTPRNPTDVWAIRREDGSWLVDGAIPIPELKDRLGVKTLPEEDKGRYNTLNGMIMLLLGRVPATGDHCEWEDWRFEVVDMDDRRIDKVLAMPRAPEEPPPPP